jgi:recombinational DNA repair protein (RecF pathway)
MILSDFRYQDPWAEKNFTLTDFIQQSSAQQRQDQQVEINRQTLDKLLTKLSLKDMVGLDHAKQYLRRLHPRRRFDMTAPPPH